VSERRVEVAGKNRWKQVGLEFEAILDGNNEEAIHRILNSNKDIFFSADLTISKFKLGDLFVTDFLNVQPSSRLTCDPRAHVSFVEIERADFPLFSKSGDPSSKLTHAVRQVQNWKSWVKTNRDYLARQIERHLVREPLSDHQEPTLRYGFAEDYQIFIGRRNSMSIEDRLLLAQMNDDLDGILIMTYDTLLDRLVEASRLRRWHDFLSEMRETA
jgi:hypothetical protein